MADHQEVQVQQKREAEKAQETTTPMRAFLPTADIFETEDALTVVLEMPGVAKENVDVNVEGGVLTVEGESISASTKGSAPYMASTTWARIDAASGCRAASTRAGLTQRCGTASSRSCCRKRRRQSRAVSLLIEL
jgi:hypothetical protein